MYDNKKNILRLKTCTKGITQKKLASMTNYSPEYISRLLNGEKPITKKNAPVLAKALGVRAEYLLCIDDYRTEEEFLEAMMNLQFLKEMVNSMLPYLDYLQAKTPSDLTDSFSGLDSSVVETLFINPGLSYIIDKKTKKWTTISEEDWSTTCQEIAEFARYKMDFLIAKKHPEDSLMNMDSLLKEVNKKSN